MVKITNLFGDSYSGQAGKSGVFAHWKGRQYRRKYVIPANPKTTMQQAVRGYFTNAIAFWHGIPSLSRLAFSYLATGLVMSGFNLLVSRWQKAATTGATLPSEPLYGIKQICSALDATKTKKPVTGGGIIVIDDEPVKIGSLTYTKHGTDLPQDAYVDLEMGDVRIPTTILQILKDASTLEDVGEGDQLLISYTSGGRTITRELLTTAVLNPTNSHYEFPAKATIALAIRTQYYPIDITSVVIESRNVSVEPDYYAQLESLEIEDLYWELVGEVVVPKPRIYFDGTAPLDVDSQVAYTSYTQIVGAKLEVVKVDTSFITWRKYSDVVGAIPIAQTLEDETYDWALSAPGYVSVIRAAQSALLSTKHELITMAAAA